VGWHNLAGDEAQGGGQNLFNETVLRAWMMEMGAPGNGWSGPLGGTWCPFIGSERKGDGRPVAVSVASKRPSNGAGFQG
jgi:hypothetical protein